MNKSSGKYARDSSPIHARQTFHCHAVSFFSFFSNLPVDFGQVRLQKTVPTEVDD